MYWRIARTYENSFREPVVEDNSHSDKWGLRNLIPVLVVEVQKVCRSTDMCFVGYNLQLKPLRLQDCGEFYPNYPN